MGKQIELDNNYYLKTVSNINNLPKNITNIENLKLKDIIRKKVLLLKIDFKELNKMKYKKVLKKLLLVRRIMKNRIQFGIEKDEKKELGYIINYDNKDKKQSDFILGINAIFFDSTYKRYNYIYEIVCAYLDSYFYGKNLCDFHNNKCAEKRNTSSTIGCCRHFKHKWLGPFSKLVECEHLKEDHTCGAKCISCKLFTCDYLEKKGIKFKIKEILLLDVFFNPLQKYFIKYMVFTPKEKILKRLVFLNPLN